MSNIKTINGLMKYLRDNHNMSVNGSTDKLKLKSIGYYHGYKGYRYIKNPNKIIQFSSFDELMSIIEFDNRVKALLYPQVMYIETALKSYVLEMIIQKEIFTNQIYIVLIGKMILKIIKILSILHQKELILYHTLFWRYLYLPTDLQQ